MICTWWRVASRRASRSLGFVPVRSRTFCQSALASGAGFCDSYSDARALEGAGFLASSSVALVDASSAAVGELCSTLPAPDLAQAAALLLALSRFHASIARFLSPFWKY